MKLITTLGTGRYEPVRYEVAGQPYETSLFPIALAQHLRPAEVLAVVTPKAREKWYDSLSTALLGHGIPCRPVDISDAHAEADLWTAFDRIAEHVEPGEEVALDITHGFRTLPLLMFLTVSYLRAARGVTLCGIYYGAYEAAIDPGDGGIKTAPMFDLTPFVALLDWTTSANEFKKTGDASGLARALDTIQRAMHHARVEDPPRQLQKLGNALCQITDPLLLARPIAVAEGARRIRARVAEAESDISRFAHPAAIIADDIAGTLSPFATPGDRPEDLLRSSCAMIDWYIRHSMWTQAVTLCRETIVSALCVRLKVDGLNRDARSEIESVLNELAPYGRTEKGDTATDEGGEAASVFETRRQQTLGRIAELDTGEQASLKAIWERVRDLRNDIAHCGLRKHPQPAATIAENAASVCTLLPGVVIELGINLIP